MSVAEMKKTILEKVETLTEEQLVQLNQFVDSINEVPAKEYDLLPHIENIVSKRAEVFKKLAQWFQLNKFCKFIALQLKNSAEVTALEIRRIGVCTCTTISNFWRRRFISNDI